MELKDFFIKLYDLDLEWQQLTAMVCSIRRHENGVGSWCPITAVAESETGKHYTMWEWGRAAQAIGLGSGDAQGIVDASDAIALDHFDDPKRNKRQEEIREQILEAVGLQEWVINEGLPPAEEAKI